MKYYINVLGNLVDENKCIILENCPIELKVIIKDFEDNIDELNDLLFNKDKQINNVERKTTELEDKIEELENQIDILSSQIEELKNN